MIESIWSKLPDWAGTMPQWLLFATVVLGFFKIWPTIRQQNFDFTAAAKKAYDERILKLEDDLKECARLSDEREDMFKAEIDRLKTKINNEEWQRVQGEISLVNTLVQLLPNDELRIILEALQRRSTTLPGSVTALGSPVTDAKSSGK